MLLIPTFHQHPSQSKIVNDQISTLIYDSVNIFQYFRINMPGKKYVLINPNLFAFKSSYQLTYYSKLIKINFKVEKCLPYDYLIICNKDVAQI